MSDAILMPVYNESSTVSDVLDTVRGYHDGEILVVNDGSTDDTTAVLAAREDVTVIAHPANLGYGRALAEGFAVARCRGVERLVTMDCDGQHEPAHIPQFLDALEEGWDVVSGSRYLPESEEVGEAPASRREVNARIMSEINRMTGWSLTDAFCGFKAYRLPSLDGMPLTEPGYAMPLQLWAHAWHRGLRVTEIPVERIYFDNDRSFGEDLDDPEWRYAYYMRVWRMALEEEQW
ncbi:MAG: glycosyltransferase family 2 protein [Coriobacteriia bacterium]|nr:glycosyltransferase family 2 protein [Coriobacteriia bacterium]